jgi:hypothetical protein
MLGAAGNKFEMARIPKKELKYFISESVQEKSCPVI